ASSAETVEKVPATINSRVYATTNTDAGLEETVASVRTELPKINGYRLTKFLSSSAMGSVYQGVAVKDNTTVAIKVITPRIPITSKMFEDFRREIDNARRIQHPNLVKLLAAGEIKGESIYMVSEFVHGENLTSIIETSPNGRISLHNSYNIILQLANAVCHLQTQGYLHMDLKPSSILIADEAGRLKAKITDQGFARFLDETGIMPRGYATDDINKLGFIAPEELSPIQDPKPTADVFSLSAVFYAMLTGRSPYRFESDLPHREVVAQGLIVPIEEALPGIPEPLVVIIERGLSVDADARYQNVCDLYEALESAWM
ncbi:MAG: serine/threonine protein kinase, partial [Planctomycetes bacterium]|nr:serine/threonine protein kinase [Planctomycetota bacterium]